MTLTIRDARTEDEAAWRQLWAGYTHFYGAPIPEAVTQHTWQRALDPAMPVIIRLAHTANTIVGFSLSILHEGSWVTTPICYLEDLFVDPAYRGQGIGKALLQAATSALHAIGIDKTHLMVLADNADAMAFYRHLGWSDRSDVRLFSYTSSGNQNS